MISRQNKLRDALAKSSRRAHLGVQVETGSNVTPNHSHTHPADPLVPNWVLGKPAAFDLSVTYHNYYGSECDNRSSCSDH